MNLENELEKIENFLKLVEAVEYKRNFIDRCNVIVSTHLKNTIFIVYDHEGDEIIRCSSYNDFIPKFLHYQVEQYYEAGRRSLQREFKNLMES